MQIDLIAHPMRSDVKVIAIRKTDGSGTWHSISKAEAAELGRKLAEYAESE